MGLIFWKNNKTIDLFANDLANYLFSTVQPKVAEDYFAGSADKKQARKAHSSIHREIEVISRKIIEFKKVNSLGVYGKARLHMKFRERLQDLGYSNNTAGRINEMIMLKTP